MKPTLKKAAKEYICYECGSTIKKSELYSKQGRGLSVGQSAGWNQTRTVSCKQDICEICTKSGVYTHEYVKMNPESFEGCVKFVGKNFGVKWCDVDEQTLKWYAQNLHGKSYYHEIQDECARRGISVEKCVS